MFKHHPRGYLNKVSLSALLLSVLALGTSAFAASADIEKKYNQSCATCHEIGVLGAPKTGNVAAWKPLLAKGEQVLIQHTKQGYKNMPARGLCDTCSDEDYAALIRFMSAPN